MNEIYDERLLPADYQNEENVSNRSDISKSIHNLNINEAQNANTEKQNKKDKQRGIDIFEKLEIEQTYNNEVCISKTSQIQQYKDTMINLSRNYYNISHNIETYNDYPFFRIQNTNKYIPKLSKESEILNKQQLRELHSFLPYFQQYKDLTLLYSMSVDGTALQTFYTKAEGTQNSILVIKDDSNNIFGAYITEDIHIKYNEFYGTAETFIFTFFDTNRIHVFPATQQNDYYIYSDNKRLAFGCSDDAFSLRLEDDFWNGYTAKTKTFNNLPLSKSEKFIVVKLELWAI